MAVDLNDMLCYRLFQIVKTNERLIDKYMEQLNLNRTQWKVIARFNFLPSPCSQQDMLNSIEIDAAHLTRVLDQLEKKGFVQRYRPENNKRTCYILLTDEGTLLLKKVENILKNESLALVKNISKKEQKSLDDILDKIKNNIQVELENQEQEQK